MLKKLPIFLLSLLFIACGTHRRLASTSTKGEASGIISTQESDKTPKEVQASSKKKEVEYKGEPWVKNISSPIEITKGLENKHISLWASHGMYYDKDKKRWKWQRPYLFCTTEDLYTQTIVVPYLIPMLERAGAIVFTPRERDWQKNEIIVDNDNEVRLPYYMEVNVKQEWKDAGITGFAGNRGSYWDGINPFTEGTTRMAKATSNKGCEISYQPAIPEAGEYAVYVSYPTHKESVRDARYTVYHKGRKTEFKVNQQIGGGTWVYLGTFDFDQGCNTSNRVTLSNVSSEKGVVTADAVRFGGGMGNYQRNGSVSGMPRFLEGARYYAEWAGAPDSVCFSHGKADDYKEDINARSYMTNWLAGGSCFAPQYKGLGVPIELSLAVHSDAGYEKDFSSLVGTLTICTTNSSGGLLASGLPRTLSKNFATNLLNGVVTDIRNKFGNWTPRTVYDKNYSETRCPLMPSAIIETLSHQNFPDMRMGQDPNFRFTLARSIYKTILRFISEEHNKSYVVEPLAPTNLSVDVSSSGVAILKWDAQQDKTEPSANPKSYLLYTASNSYGFDNGTKVSGTSCKINLDPGVLYNFRVTAVNEGGESFPSETVSALYQTEATKSILIINGFQRLSSPAVINNTYSQGFDLDADPGVSYGKMPGYSGHQICFDKSKIGIEGPGGLGYSGSELEGKIIRGNEFNYITEHAEAIMASGKYNISSCSKYAIENTKFSLSKYDCIDLILGLEKDDGHSLLYYKSFSLELQQAISSYINKGGNIIASGSFIASDMRSPEDSIFLEKTLHLTYLASKRPQTQSEILGMGTSFDIYTLLNEQHYAATSIDLIGPTDTAFCALTHQGNSVCVAYDGKDRRSFALGFPFECIKDSKKRALIMGGILNFIFK